MGEAKGSPPLALSMAALLVALGQLFLEVGEGVAHLLGEHEEVVEQVACLVEVALEGLSFQAKLYPIGSN